jgi:hypothetical protein
MYQAQGPLWHKRDRDQERIPPGLRNVDLESAWSKSGYRGWVQGYRLVLQGLVFPARVPLFSRRCSNAVGESTVLQEALATDHFPITELLLGDSTFGRADLVATYAQHHGWLLTPRQLPANPESWQHALYAYRRETIELLFQRIMQTCDLKVCPAKGLARSGPLSLPVRGSIKCSFWTTIGTTAPWPRLRSLSMKPAGGSQPELCADFNDPQGSGTRPSNRGA